MSWRQDLNDSSFRGVKFTTTDSSGSHGRRGADHQFPGRDEPYAEDAGRRQRSYPVGGVIAGNDYLKQLKKMIDASEKAGPGVLVHPYLGKMTIMCRDFSWEASVEEGGMATISFMAVEAGSLTNPAQVASTLSGVTGASETLLDATEDEMSTFDTIAKSTYVAAQWAADGSDRITELGETVTGPFVATVDNLLAITVSLAAIDAYIKTLAALPSVLAARTRTAFDIIGSLSVVKMFTGTDSQQAAELAATSTAGEASLQLWLEASRALNQQMMLARHSLLLAAEDFTSYDQAIAERDKLADLINAELLVGPSDAVYSALVDLLAASQNDINARAQDLPRIRDLRLNNSMPSLALAQELYGDATRSEEITTRNNTPHPAFVVGDIQVLSR